MSEQRENTDVVLTNEQRGLGSINLLDEKEIAVAESYFKRMMATDKGGIKSVNEAFAILARAKDMQLPFTACLEHIHIINGKTGVDVHIIKALLLRAQVTWEKTKDYTCLYEYTDGSNIFNESELPDYCVKCRNAKEAEEATKDDKLGVYPLPYYCDLSGNIYNELQLNDKCIRTLNKVQALKVAKEGKFPVMRIGCRPIDYETEYKFTRYFKIDGKLKEVTSIGKFTFKDAMGAGLLEKDNYKKYPKVMIAHRAFVLGAREIADDVLMGCMETTELKSTYNVNIEEADYQEI